MPGTGDMYGSRQIAFPLAECLVLALGLLGIAGCGGQSSTSNTAPTPVDLAVTPTSVAFGGVTIGESGAQSISLTNGASSSLVVNTATVTGTGFSLGNLSLPVTLSAGQSTTVHVTFTPNGASSYSGSITVTSTAANSPSTISLSGTGISRSISALAPLCGAADDGQTHLP